MKVEITEASLDDKPILRRLLEFSEYELSEFDDSDLNEYGEFGYRYLDQYWVEPERHAFLFRVEGRLAGFALVNAHSYTGRADHSMAEFLVMRKYQRKGIGKVAAHQIISRFPGTWEIRQFRRHSAALVFWRKTISEYTSDDFEEIESHIQWDGPIQLFVSKG